MRGLRYPSSNPRWLARRAVIVATQGPTTHDHSDLLAVGQPQFRPVRRRVKRSAERALGVEFATVAQQEIVGTRELVRDRLERDHTQSLR